MMSAPVLDSVRLVPDAMEHELSAHTLVLDADAECARICTTLRHQLQRHLRKRGAIVGVSGGIDSSVTLALCVQALGPEHVLAVFMPERDSDPLSLSLGQELTATFGVESVTEDIGPALDAMGCYQRRDDVIRRLVPEFGDGWGCKVVFANALQTQGYNLTFLVVRSPDGHEQKLRMPADVYLGLVAATNMKQRTRKQIEYYHADRLNYAVMGTPNRLEYDQGFFVKNGDGAADLKPIAHLYKSQVFQLARHLGVPDDICKRTPTTDTWSLAQTQEEFYFALPYQSMDLCLYGLNHSLSQAEVARACGLTAEQVQMVWKDIAAKRRVAATLHQSPLLVEEIC